MQRHNSDDNGETAVSNDTIYGNKVSGDVVAGDQYTLDIKDSEAVAIGVGARAEINHYTEIILVLTEFVGSDKLRQYGLKSTSTHNQYASKKLYTHSEKKLQTKQNHYFTN